MINPVLIMGPSIAAGGGVSEKFIEALLHNSAPSNKPAGNGYVDVREVAQAHLNGVKLPEAANKRFLLQSDEKTKKEFAAILRDKFAQRGFQIFDWEDPADINAPRNSNKRAREVLQVKFRPLEETLEDMVESLIAAGKIDVPAQKSWW